ncbi:hypothetical protein TeGR_g3007, partial [Tetraparma gracilis]
GGEEGEKGEEEEEEEEEGEEDEDRPKGWRETFSKHAKRATRIIHKKSRQLKRHVRDTYGDSKKGNDDDDDDDDEDRGLKREASWYSRGFSTMKSIGRNARGSWRKSFGGKKKKKGEEGPEFDLIGAATVGEGPLPYLSIEVYDMDYGVRGDFMGEARVSITRILDVFVKDTIQVPLLPKLGTDLKDMDKKDAKLIKGYVEVQIELDHVDAERIRREAEEKEEARKRDPVQALLGEPDVTNGVLGLAVFADVEAEREIAQREKAEAARIANEIEAKRLEEERERENGELWEMSYEDERAFEIAESEEMEAEDWASREYRDGQDAHDDLYTWTVYWSEEDAQHYWYNEVTGFTSWVVPDALNKDHWKPRWRVDLGRYLYDNVVTGQKDEDQIPPEPEPEPMIFAEIVKNGDEDVRVWRIPVTAYEDEEEEEDDEDWGEEEGGGQLVLSPQEGQAGDWAAQADEGDY